MRRALLQDKGTSSTERKRVQSGDRSHQRRPVDVAGPGWYVAAYTRSSPNSRFQLTSCLDGPYADGDLPRLKVVLLKTYPPPDGRRLFCLCRFSLVPVEHLSYDDVTKEAETEKKDGDKIPAHLLLRPPAPDPVLFPKFGSR